jgi:SPP1 gp7 family putative phage head morphogenesis protein
MPEVQPFGLKFDEAIAFLKTKLPEASLKWDSLAGPVHAKVFTIAGSTSADLSRDIQASLVKAISDGTTITQFRKDFDKAVQQYGWSYNGKRGWRTSVIFDTNMRSAHMAGRWQQVQANKDRRPFLQYRTAGDARVRPQHKQWNGLIFPVDHPFWQTHYPPNGWGCRCTVRAYSQADLTERNLSQSPDAPIKTREVAGFGQVPVGIDPGWDHNVGASWLAPEVALGQKLAKLPQELRGPMIDKTISPAFQTVIKDNFKAFRTAIKDAPEGQKITGAGQIIGFMDSATTKAAATMRAGELVESTAIVLLDKNTRHIEGLHKSTNKARQVWPSEWIDSLPEHLRNYRAVLWDINADSLIVIPQGSFNNTVPKIVLRLNRRTTYGQAAELVSLGTTDLGTLRDANSYRLLVGNLK